MIQFDESDIAVFWKEFCDCSLSGTRFEYRVSVLKICETYQILHDFTRCRVKLKLLDCLFERGDFSGFYDLRECVIEHFPVENMSLLLSVPLEPDRFEYLIDREVLFAVKL